MSWIRSVIAVVACSPALTAGAAFTLDLLLSSTEQVTLDARCTWAHDQPDVSCTVGSNERATSFGRVEVIHHDYRVHGPCSRTTPASDEVVRNVFPGASPVLVATASERLLLWQHQDLADEPLQSLEIAWSADSGDGWSVPAPVVDDTRVELHPVAGVAADGRTVAAWLRIRDAAFTTEISSAADLPLFYTRLEVVSAVFDALELGWAFADGTPCARGSAVTHTFHRPGEHPVLLAVHDPHGATDVATVRITVAPKPGDVDGDGAVTGSDLLALVAHLFGAPAPYADVTGDGTTDAADLTAELELVS